MKLSKFPLKKGIFLSRPNRFIAILEIDGKEIIAHVPNTGRMSELLVSGVRAIASYNSAPNRKTDYTLLLVEHKGLWVSIHSGLANKAAYEYMKKQPGITNLRREITYRNSRFDLAFTRNGINCLYEAKSVNLVEDGIAMFPDAPTLRGKKHLEELMEAREDGYETGVVFVVQRNDAKEFSANSETDRNFKCLLDQCHSLGMDIRALSCDIDGVNIEITGEIPVLVQE